MEFGETKIQSETIYDGKILKLNKDIVKLQNNSKTYREIIHHPGACCVVAIDNNKDILMVRQFRYAINQQILEIPAGKLDVPEESPLLAAKRELLEETGYVSDDWSHLITIPSNATIADNLAYIYVAKNCRKMSGQSLDEMEFLNAVRLDADEIEKLISDGEFKQAMHVMGWLLAQRQ